MESDTGLKDVSVLKICDCMIPRFQSKIAQYSEPRNLRLGASAPLYVFCPASGSCSVSTYWLREGIFQ